MSLPDGHYYDGRTAARRPVRIVAEPHGLAVTDPDGRPLTKWLYAEIDCVERPRAGQPVRLRNRAAPKGRLVIENQDLVTTIREAAPRLWRPGLKPASLRTIAAVAAVAVAIVAAFVIAIPRLAPTIAAMMPPAWEVAMGEAAVTPLLDEWGRCRSPAGDAALDSLTARLERVATAPYPFSVQVADLDVVNAFAGPGGQIVLLRRLVESARSADEVAGVLAHGMAHVIERHPTQRLVRVMGFGLLAEFLSGGGSSLAAAAAGFGTILVKTAYSREAEAEADRIAIGILERAGFRTAALAEFFRRLKEEEAEGGISKILTYVSSHPPLDERERAALAGAADDAPAGPALAQSEWRALRGICG